MSEALTRWFGWVAMLLLVLGAVGAFFSQYRAMETVLASTRALVLRDEIYLENTSSNTAPVAGNGMAYFFMDNPQLSDAGLSGVCSSTYLQSLWLLDDAKGDRLSRIQVDGIALEALDVKAIRETATFRMTSRVAGDGTDPFLSFESMP